MERQAEVMIPTRWGNFTMIAYADHESEKMPHLAMVHERFKPGADVFVRIHSECLTGDLWGSKRCDCGEQLDKAMQIASEQGGVIIYLRQEGRGIGIINKIKAYILQDAGLNTIDANIHLGFEADERSYEIAVTILRDLNISGIRLLTNNPEKIDALTQMGIIVKERIPLIIQPQTGNAEYLRTKQDQMGHMLDLK
ncbi:MAG: GTP cyclohydrolase II [Saprospiraceae bacterium]|nr:GTP cyclohydrolase II [Saprospiraceae bacterium]